METANEMFAVEYEDAPAEEVPAEGAGAPEEPKTFLERVCELQATVKAPKDLFNAYGGFKYRSKESILEAAKPVAKELGLMILVDDEVRCRGDEGNDWHYILSTATLIDTKTGETFKAHGWAREPEAKKGMDVSQVTGTAASYAGKRALGNLLSIDDTADADGPSVAPPPQVPAKRPFTARCQSCGTVYQFESPEQYSAFVASATCCPSPNWAPIQ